MKLVILGATGGTGQHLISEALEKGYDVTAVARNPNKLVTKHDKLKIIEADLTVSSQLVEPFRGADAVLSTVGGRPGFSACTIYSAVGRATVEAMREADVKRLVAVTAWGTKDDPDLPFIWRWVLKPSVLRAVVSDMEILEDYLQSQCSDINYTVVRPPKLTNAPSTGSEVKVQEGQLVHGYKNEICRHDLAKFVLRCLETEEYNKKMVAVAGDVKI